METIFGSFSDINKIKSQKHIGPMIAYHDLSVINIEFTLKSLNLKKWFSTELIINVIPLYGYE